MNNREIKFRAWDGSQMSSNVITIQELANKDFAWDANKLVWLEYTGLKDKNGIEIYDGDVVKWTVNDVDRISEVIFDSGCFWMNKVWNDWLRGEYEVIGNIYENPELL